MKKQRRAKILRQRERTHGSFADNAQTSQAIKLTLHLYGWRHLCTEHREVFDAIAMKMGRILSGKAKHKDHWLDIAGYATLAAEACDRRKKRKG